MVFVLFKPKLTGDYNEMYSDYSYSWTASDLAMAKALLVHNSCSIFTWHYLSLLSHKAMFKQIVTRTIITV